MKTKFVITPKFAQVLAVAASLVLADLSRAAVLSVDINDVAQSANTQTGFDPLVTPGGAFSSLSGTFSGVTITVAGLGETLQSAVRNLPANGAHLTSAA